MNDAKKNLTELKKVSSLKSFMVMLIVFIMMMLIIMMMLMMTINTEKLEALEDSLKCLIEIITNQ